MKRITMLVVLACLVLLFTASTCFAQTITTFDVPGSTYTYPTAINPGGTIVGYGYDFTQQHSFLRQPDGTITTFDVPNVSEEDDNYCAADGWRVDFTRATDMNSAGQVVGVYQRLNQGCPTSERVRAFLREKDGTFTTFWGPWPFPVSPYVGGLQSGNITINARGQIAGWFGTDSGGLPFVGFVRKRDGTITEFVLPTDNIPRTFPTAINARGEITGYAGPWCPGCNFDGSIAFLREPGGTITTFEVPSTQPNSFTTPTAINSAGQITGYFGGGAFLRQPDGTITTFTVFDSTSTTPTAIAPNGDIVGYAGTYGFLRKHDGTIVTLDVPNSLDTHPTAINSAGRITGWYDSAGGTNGFVWTP